MWGLPGFTAFIRHFLSNSGAVVNSFVSEKQRAGAFEGEHKPRSNAASGIQRRSLVTHLRAWILMQTQK